MRKTLRETALVYQTWISSGIFALGVVLFLMGCGTEFSKSKNQEKQLTHDTVELSTLDLFKYRIRVSWPQGYENIRVLLNDHLAFHTDSKEVTFCELDVPHNMDYHVQVYGVPSGSDVSLKNSSKLIYERQIQTPLDIELSQWLQMNEGIVHLSIQAHRVYLSSNQTAFTNGRNIVINTDELISEDGTLSTFPENQKAPVDQPGRSGGIIIIKAQKAIGNLNVHLNGEHGGDGSDGAPYSNPANPGANGTIGDYFLNCKGSRQEMICTCSYKSAYLEAGGNGADGQPGRRGGDGGSGGNSGLLKIEIAEMSSAFHPNISSQIGRSGKPGLGGPGQPGGSRGLAFVPPDDPWTTYICNGRRDGLPGATGAPGKDGVKQPDGNIEQNCISIGEGFGRCSN